jgi:Flp pilus assembly protein TadB
VATLILSVLVLAAAWRCRPRPMRAAMVDSDPMAHPCGVSGFLEIAAREVRTGSSVAVAVDEGLRRAGSDADALRAAMSAAPGEASADVALAAHAVRRASIIGHQPAAVFDRAAATLRERDACRAEQRAHTAQARLSARVLTVVPVGFAAFAVATNPSVRRVYVGSPVGVVLVAAGAGLNVLGWWWMRRIVQRATRP